LIEIYELFEFRCG